MADAEYQRRLAAYEREMAELQAARRDDAPFVVEEFDRETKSLGAVQSADDRGLNLFLGRTAKDTAAPKRLHLVVADGSSLDRVWAAVKACTPQATACCIAGVPGTRPPISSVRR